MFVLQGGEHMNKLLKDLYDCFYTPPELAADIMDRGIVLTGGGAMLHGMDALIEQKTGVSTLTVQDAMLVVAAGTGKYAEIMSRV